MDSLLPRFVEYLGEKEKRRLLKAEDVIVLPNGAFAWGGWSRELRSRAAEKTTVIIGYQGSGKTLLAETLLDWLPRDGIKVGFLPETVYGRESRPWEDPRLIDARDQYAWWDAYNAGEFITAYCRRRSLTNRWKMGAVSSSLYRQLVKECDVVITTVNLRAAYELERYTFPPNIGCILQGTDVYDLSKMQGYRPDLPADCQGLGESPFGVESPIKRLPGTLWYHNYIVEGVEDLDEVHRRQLVKAELARRFEDPLTEAELAHFHTGLREEFLPVTRGQMMLDFLLRSQPGRGVNHSMWTGLKPVRKKQGNHLGR